MSHIIADRVKEKIQSPASTGILSLLNTTSGYRRFSSVMSSGDTCYYCLECPSNGDWECGLGTYSSNNALSRTAVYSSSNGGAVVNFANRVSYVFISYVASRAIYLDPSGELNLALNTLNDVSLTAPASGESLKYNGSSWVNGVVAGYTTEEAQDAVGGILTDTSSISFSYNDGAPSIAASVKNSGVTNDMLATGIDALKIGSGTVSSAEFGYLDGVTSSLQVQLDSKYDSANPSGYISASGVAAAYQPLDADLTSLAAASGSGIYERSGGSWTPVVIGTGLSLGSGTLSNTLDLSSYLTSSVASGTYLPLAGGTLTGDLKFTDATYDIGKSGLTRPRDGFFSRNLTVGGTSTFDGGGYVPNTTSLAFQCISPFQASTASIYGTYCSIGNGVGLGFSSAGTPIAKLGSGAGTVSFELNGTSAIGANGGYNCKLIGGSIDFAVGTFLSHTTGLSLSSVGLYGAGNTLKIVNSTNAQTFDLFNTYTSATSLEAFRIKAVAAAAYQIGSAIGSAGGTNRAITFGHWNTAGAFTGTAGITTAGTYGGRFSDTGGAAEGAEQFGESARTSYQSLAVGAYATAMSNYGTAVGRCSFAGQFCTAIGRNAGAVDTSGGFPITHPYQYCITISGGDSNYPPTASNQFMVAGAYTEAFFGKGVVNSSPSDIRFQTTGGSGTNIAGASFTFAGGKGTGTGAGGSLIFQTAPAGSAGSTLNSLVTRLTVDSTGLSTFAGPITLTQPVSTTGSPTAFTLTGAAHTTLTLSTEATDVNFNLSRTVQFATGALTTQRAMRIQAPTYSFVGASTITTASTLSISGPPVAGTNATITNAYALDVESGKSRFGGEVAATSFKPSGVGVASGYTATSGSSTLQTHYYWRFSTNEVAVDNSAFTFDQPTYRDVRNGNALVYMLAGTLLSGDLLRLNATAHTSGLLIAAQLAGVNVWSLEATGKQIGNSITTRNGTSPTSVVITNTYTSATSYETLNLKGKAAANFEIGPENGSAGGTLRGLTLGGYTAGSATITPWLTFTNAGAATFAGAITASNLSGTNTGDQDLSSYATTSAVAAGYVALTGTQTVAGVKTFTSSLTYSADGAALSQTYKCYNPSTANGTQFLCQRARGSAATPLYPASGDVLLGLYGYGWDQNLAGFSLQAHYICSASAAWTTTPISQGTQWTWGTTDPLDIATVNTNRMRLHGDGSLTLGSIASTGGLFQLVGTNTAATGLGTATNRLRFTDIDTSVLADQPIGEIEFYSGDGSPTASGVRACFGAYTESTALATAFVWGLGAANATPSEVMRLTSTGRLGLGTAGVAVSAFLHVISTSLQMRVGYDVSNYYTTTVSSGGAITFEAVGASAGFTFSDPVTLSSTSTATGLLTATVGIKTTKTIYQTTETTSTPAAGAVTIDLTLNNHQTLSLTSLAAAGTSQVTFTPPTGSSAGTLIVKQHATASKDITTWAVTGGTIKWMGTEPNWVGDAATNLRVVSWRWDGSIMYLAATDVGT